MKIQKVVTLEDFIATSQMGFSFATGELSGLLRDISLAAKMVNRAINKAGLVDILGLEGNENVQGEEVKKLDVFANEHFIHALSISGQCAGIASEEEENFITIPSEAAQKAKYVVCIDPLDGSSNIDVNVSIGTIFSIYQRVSPTPGPCKIEDFLQAGNKQVAAGYVIYGSSTMLVYTTGTRVNGFTLDPSIGEFCLSHRDIRVPKQGHIYSVNTGNINHFPEGVKDYIYYCNKVDKATKRPYSSRYIGSMVADFHRNLIKGGIFLYPATLQQPGGKLRLLYECNPMAFIIEKAGGCATDGEQRILDLRPTKLHQRCPVFIGSAHMVARLEEFVNAD